MTDKLSQEHKLGPLVFGWMRDHGGAREGTIYFRLGKLHWELGWWTQ